MPKFAVLTKMLPIAAFRKLLGARFIRSGARAFVIVIITLSTATISAGTERPFIVNEASNWIGVYPRPTIGDTALIVSIAEAGAAQRVDFPAGANVLSFIAEKCGQPSEGMLVHPAYEAVLLKKNKNIPLEPPSLTHLPKASTVEIPACAMFDNAAGRVAAPNGIQELAKDYSIPFDLNSFKAAVEDPAYRSSLAIAYSSVRENGSATKFQQAVKKSCKDNKISVFDDAYLACSNAVEIAAATPRINNPLAYGDIQLPGRPGLSRAS